MMTTSARPKFRETLWFLKGEKDAEARAEGAGDPMHPQAVDLLPVEDRYLDDGSVRPSQSAMFSIRTGTTDFLEKIQDVASDESSVPTSELVRELKGGRRRILAAIGTAALVLGTVLALCAF